MIFVTVDFGSYSVKILESRVDKKKIRHVNKIEIPIGYTGILPENPEEKKDKDLISKIPFLPNQVAALVEYLSKLPEGTKILFQTPIDLCSTRFIEVPVKQRKKAEMMVPFQLEEEIPYVISEVHISSTLSKTKDGYKSIASYIPLNTFEDYWEFLDNKNIVPAYLTTEVSCWQNYVNDSQKVAEDETFAILDIGHRKSVAYFFNQKELVAYNISYSSGASINEMITANYDVEPSKAIEFKHKNAFFLVPEQYEDVDPKQKEFATKMDEALKPLIRDFKRWELSFRVSHSLNINSIYITGGTARTKNIENYLAHELGKPVRFLEDQNSNFQSFKTGKDEFLSLANVNALSYFYKHRQDSNNFLTGKYLQARSEELPLYSIAHIGIRLAIVTVFIITALSIESFFLGKRNLQLSRSVRGALSQPDLALTDREKRYLGSNPEALLTKIKRKMSGLEKDIKEIESTSQAHGFQGLFQITEKVSTDCHLTRYKDSTDGQVQATFSQCPADSILNLAQSIKNAGLKDLTVNPSPNQGRLTVKFNL